MDLEPLFEGIRRRFAELSRNGDRRRRFVAHIEALADWEKEKALDYPDVAPDFPESVFIAFAVCHPSCGTRELIVDGSTQECQACGRLMYRVETRTYVRA
jgi:hypothetical protein